MDFKVNNNQSTSLCGLPERQEERWNITDDVYRANVFIDELIQTLNTLDKFKKMYPDEKSVIDFERLIRKEICKMMGGELKDE